MAEGFERLADEHPWLAGTLAMAVVVLVFGWAGGVESGSMPFPF